MIMFNKGAEVRGQVKKKLSPGAPALDFGALTSYCRKDINSFSKLGKRFETPDGPYFYINNNSDILAIGHLDTFLPALHTTTAKLYHDTMFFCPTLDDRAGVYAILDYLPKHGLKYDVLLTTGEEKGRSTSAYFQPPKGKRYNWMFSFDRQGTDVVMYDYYNLESRRLLEENGWKVGTGTYSDIVDLEHLRCKGYNFGVGYHAQHTKECYLSKNEFMENMRKFLRFYNTNMRQHHTHVPQWNIYSAEDGFGYLYLPRAEAYQDTFTDSDIEVLEILNDGGYDFGTRVNPQNVKTIIEDFQKGRILPKGEGILVEPKQPKAKPKSNYLVKLPLLKNVKRYLVGSEDNPDYNDHVYNRDQLKLDFVETKKQPRKAGDLTHREASVPVEVVHDELPTLLAIKSEVEDNGQVVAMCDECSTCHAICEFDPLSDSSECDDCRELRLQPSKEIVMSDIKEVVSNGGARIVAKLMLNKRKKETNERLKYVKTNSGGKGYEWQYEYPEREILKAAA